MSRHSKGPWTRHGNIIFSGSEPIALIKTANDTRGSAQRQEANANLIAAAPELLETLDGTLQFIELMGMKVPEDFKIVLNKAKGQSS